MNCNCQFIGLTIALAVCDYLSRLGLFTITAQIIEVYIQVKAESLEFIQIKMVG